MRMTLKWMCVIQKLNCSVKVKVALPRAVLHGQKMGRVSNSKSGRVSTLKITCLLAKQPSLNLKAQHQATFRLSAISSHTPCILLIVLLIIVILLCVILLILLCPFFECLFITTIYKLHKQYELQVLLKMPGLVLELRGNNIGTRLQRVTKFLCLL